MNPILESLSGLSIHQLQIIYGSIFAIINQQRTVWLWKPSRENPSGSFHTTSKDQRAQLNKTLRYCLINQSVQTQMFTSLFSNAYRWPITLLGSKTDALGGSFRASKISTSISVRVCSVSLPHVAQVFKMESRHHRRATFSYNNLCQPT